MPNKTFENILNINKLVVKSSKTINRYNLYYVINQDIKVLKKLIELRISSDRGVK